MSARVECSFRPDRLAATFSLSRRPRFWRAGIGIHSALSVGAMIRFDLAFRASAVSGGLSHDES